MSRKDYIAAAAVIKASLPELDKDISKDERYGRLVTARLIAHGMSAVFSADNPNFDAERFIAACGTEDYDAWEATTE